MRIVQAEEEDAAPEPMAGVFTSLARATMEPPKWIVKDLIPVGLSVIGAPPKALKSTFMMAISVMIAGVKCSVLPKGMDSVDVRGRVMGFSFEASSGELLHMCEHGLGVSVPDDDSIQIADDPWLFQLDDENGIKKLIFWLNEFKPKLCFIDPFAEAHSLEEKDSRSMIQILRPLHRWAKDNDSAIVIVHHTRKRGTEDTQQKYTALDLRGSSAIFGKMDGVLIFTPHEETPGLITIDAKFKRGKAWIRDIQFAAYGEKGVGKVRATEVLDDVARMVLGVLRAGVTERRVIASQCGIRKSRVSQAIDALVRCGVVCRVGKRGIKIMKRKHKER